MFWSVKVVRVGEGSGYLEVILKTLFLGSSAALNICLAAVLLAYSRRRNKSWSNLVLCRIATVGYAMPGTVLAVGIFIPVSKFDNLLRQAMETIVSIDPGPIFQGTLVVMLAAYLIRFLAVGFGAVDSGMQNIKPSLDDA